MFLSFNVDISAVSVFPMCADINLELEYNLQPIRQVSSIKYLGLFYDLNLRWCLHLDNTHRKGLKAIRVLQRCSNVRSRMSRNTLLLLYKSYVRPILEFGCIMFSGLFKCTLSGLFVLRLCLGLPTGVANAVLYSEARVPPLQLRLRYLTISSYLRLLDCPLFQTISLLLNTNELFRFKWRKHNVSQLLYANNLLSEIGHSFP